MRNLKNAIFRLQSRVASLRKALLIIIDDDEAMALMNLSLLRAEPELYTYVLHTILYFLFRSKLMRCFWSHWVRPTCSLVHYLIVMQIRFDEIISNELLLCLLPFMIWLEWVISCCHYLRQTVSETIPFNILWLNVSLNVLHALFIVSDYAHTVKNCWLLQWFPCYLP